MGYEIRTLATLAGQARQFFTQSIPGAVASLWANTFTVLGKVLALLDFEHEMRRQALYQQLFASTAAEVWLKRHGFELGLTPDSGTAASGTISIPCGGLVEPIPEGTTFTRADGATYSTVTVTQPPTIGATIDLVVQANLVGSAYNVVPGATLTLVPTAGVPFQLGSQATVDSSGLTGGVDAEALESFRARVLYRKRNPPQGGSVPDYVEWAQAALATVTNVYVDSFQNDSRSVWLCFTVSDQPNGIPTPAQVATVEAYASDPVRRPVTARVFATGPTEVDVPIVITNFSPDTPDTRAAAAAEIAALQIDEIQPATPTSAFTLFVETIEAAINSRDGGQELHARESGRPTSPIRRAANSPCCSRRPTSEGAPMSGDIAPGWPCALLPAVPPSVADRLSAPTADDILPQLLQLTPRGPAWGTDEAGDGRGAGAVMLGVWRAIAGHAAQNYATEFELATQCFPSAITYSLADWRKRIRAARQLPLCFGEHVAAHRGGTRQVRRRRRSVAGLLRLPCRLARLRHHDRGARPVSL